MERIFISYKRIDKDKVFRIKDRIEIELGERCWIDIDGIESDSQFKNVIIKAINACEVVLFMYSKCHSEITDWDKDWTVRELNFAAKKNKRIVFVNIDGSPLTDIFEFDYGTKQQIDGLSEDSLSRLIRDLETWLQLPKKEPCPAPDTRRRFSFFKIFGILLFVLFVTLFMVLFFKNPNCEKKIIPELMTDSNPLPETEGERGVGEVGGIHEYTDSLELDSIQGSEIPIPMNGWYYYDDGTFSEFIDAEKFCVGVIFGVGKTSEEEKARGFSQGYIMALHDAYDYAVQWGEYGYQTKNAVRSKSQALSDCDGFSHCFMDGQYKDGDRLTAQHSAFFFATAYSARLPEHTTGWYLPSVGQWNLFMQDVLLSPIGEKWNEQAKMKLKEMNFRTAFYWTSTDYGFADDDSNKQYGDAWNVEMLPKNRATLHTYCRAYVGLVRSVAAF